MKSVTAVHNNLSMKSHPGKTKHLKNVNDANDDNYDVDDDADDVHCTNDGRERTALSDRGDELGKLLQQEKTRTSVASFKLLTNLYIFGSSDKNVSVEKVNLFKVR